MVKRRYEPAMIAFVRDSRLCIFEEMVSPLGMNGGVGVGQSGVRYLASESHALTRGVGSW